MLPNPSTAKASHLFQLHDEIMSLQSETNGIPLFVPPSENQSITPSDITSAPNALVSNDLDPLSTGSLQPPTPTTLADTMSPDPTLTEPPMLIPLTQRITAIADQLTDPGQASSEFASGTSTSLKRPSSVASDDEIPEAPIDPVRKRCVISLIYFI